MRPGVIVAAVMTPASPGAGMPRTLPAGHRRFLDNLVRVLPEDARIVGIAIGGSFLSDSMDAFSDLDLVIAVEPADYAGVQAARPAIAASLGNLLAAFTGEHVGEPRLLICLYGEPLLHVDLKFVALDDLAARIEDPFVLWERQGRVSAVLARTQARYPRPDRQWIEDRFWTWVHYGAAKIGRGELLETVDFLGGLRGQVLAPLGAERAGRRPGGVRRIEAALPDLAVELRATLAGATTGDCLRALRACVELYRSLRAAGPAITERTVAERAAVEYLDEIAQGAPAGS